MPSTTTQPLENIWTLASDGNIAGLLALISQGMSINSQDATGYSILHAAASYSHLELIQILISRGAIVDIRDADGDTPLHVAESAECAQMLLNANPCHLCRNLAGLLPIETAWRDGNTDVVDVLRSLTPEFREVSGSDANGSEINAAEIEQQMAQIIENEQLLGNEVFQGLGVQVTVRVEDQAAEDAAEVGLPESVDIVLNDDNDQEMGENDDLKDLPDH